MPTGTPAPLPVPAATETSWSVDGPQTLEFDDPFEQVRLRLIGGTVNVVGREGPGARVEISEVGGLPLRISRRGSALTVAYEDLPWKGLLSWLDAKARGRRQDHRAVVTLSVPASARLSVGVIDADTVVTGMAGRTRVSTVSGDATLVGLSGPVRAETVSGELEAQSLSGSLEFHSVSGGLTVVDGSSPAVKADSVSGDMILDLDPRPGAGAADYRLNTVSGEIAVRLPHPPDARVEASTGSGAVSSAFEELRTEGQWGAKKVTGVLGDGSGRLKAVTATGSVALLRRPSDDPADGSAAPAPDGDPDSPAPAPEGSTGTTSLRKDV